MVRILLPFKEHGFDPWSGNQEPHAVWHSKKNNNKKLTTNCWFCWRVVSLIRLCLIWDEATLGAARKRFAGSNSRYPLLP